MSRFKIVPSFFQCKYDVVGTIPVPGKGGEYEVQDGFGWTNGAILDLLVTYADRITAGNVGDDTTTPATSTKTFSQSMTNITTQTTSPSVASTVTSSKSTPSTTTTNDGKTFSLNFVISLGIFVFPIFLAF